MTRSEYLKHHLSKTLSADVIDPAQITYELVAQASSSLLEYWQITRKSEVDATLALNPDERERRTGHKTEAIFERYNIKDNSDAEAALLKVGQYSTGKVAAISETR